ncbi:C-type lectin domain family 4 member M [Ictalurus punctatus]|uniref:C-type lectin domain family 4 member M n=1 Tax=Ictalurus punctatus TaxID=7998 RepID=A0A9F7RBL0_ICTPU|nr:C-type lectin domain family 4 member M [Ictalurus punctatus]
MEVREKDADSESIYMNVEDAEETSNQSEIYENIYLNRTTEIPGSTGACERRKVNCSNMASVGLGFLCVLLLAVIVLLCIKHNKEMQQIQSGNDNMTIERDRLQSSYNIVTSERNRLQSSYNIVTSERNRLQSSYNIVTSERNRLQNSYNALKYEKDAIQKKLTEIDSCPSGWTRFLSSCYRVSPFKNTWEESRHECRRTGADLVIINSREEQQFVSGLGLNVWIGLTDREQEGEWKWVDNTPLESGYWKNNEPNNIVYLYADEDCAEVISNIGSSSVISNWNDIHCNRYSNGLCEKKIRCSTQ